MRSITDKINLFTQVLSASFYALFLAGFQQIDPNQSAIEIVAAFKAQSLPLIIGALINFGTMAFLWVRTWKTDKPNFWAFIKSRSWLLSVANIVIPLLGTVGFYLANEDYTKLVDYALNGEWTNFVSLLILSIIGFIGTLLKKKVAVAKE